MPWIESQSALIWIRGGARPDCTLKEIFERNSQTMPPVVVKKIILSKFFVGPSLNRRCTEITQGYFQRLFRGCQKWQEMGRCFLQILQEKWKWGHPSAPRLIELIGSRWQQAGYPVFDSFLYFRRIHSCPSLDAIVSKHVFQHG